MGLLRELNRRSVFRVAMAYLVIGWFLLQASDVLFGILQLPEWSKTLVAALLVLGFVPVLVFAWAFEFSSGGIRRTSKTRAADESSARAAQRLDVTVIVLLVISLGMLFYLRDDLPQNVAATQAAQLPPIAQDQQAISVAVLPFENMSDSRAHAFFSDGLTEEVLNLLAQVDDFRVASRTSSFHYGDVEEDLQVIGSQMGVSYILEGSVRTQGDVVRVTAQLISVADGFHLWSSTYDREMRDVFRLQSEVAAAIASSMTFTLLSRADDRLTTTIDPQTYSTFLVAKAKQAAISAREISEAHGLLLQVTQNAPEFAPGWASLASTSIALGSVYRLIPPDEAAATAEDAIGRALALRPDLPEAYLARAQLARYQYQLTGDEAYADEARQATDTARSDL
jgi:TolB-like protein